MTDPQVALMMLGLFILIVFLGFPIAFTLMAMGIGFGYYAYFDAGRMWRAFNRLDEAASWWESTRLWIEGFYNNRIFDLFINQTYTVMSNEVLTAVPLFLFMGYIVERANIVDRLFTTLNIASKRIPGSMGVAALITCALFATATGIVGAVVTLMGLLALPAMLKARYDTSFASGIICAGGTLGILIPPSINLIVYGLLTDTSVPELYLAGFLPGLILAGLFMLTVVLFCVFRPHLDGDKVQTSWSKRISVLPDLLPPLGIFLVVVGSIYAGWATPTEAASLGVVAALILAAGYKTLSIQMLREAIEGTMRTTAMVMLIIMAAIFLNFVLGMVGLTQALASFITSLGLTPFQTLLAVIAFYLILGCFMETLSMLITTAPIITPIIVGLGYDPVWFGILLMVMLETALITPPIGVNLYVVQGVRGKGPMSDVMMGIIPFLIAMFAMIAILVGFPEIALWLPSLFY